MQDTQGTALAGLAVKQLLQGSQAPPWDVQQDGGTRGDPERSQGSRGKRSPILSIMHAAHGKRRKKALCPFSLSSSPLPPQWLHFH